MRTVYRGRAHAIFLQLFKCSVIKIINCCQGLRGRSRPLRHVAASRSFLPERTNVRRPVEQCRGFPAVRSTIVPLGKTDLLPPVCYAGGWLNCQRTNARAEYSGVARILFSALYTHIIRKESPPHCAPDANLRRKSNCSLRFRHLLSGLFPTRAPLLPFSPSPLLPFSPSPLLPPPCFCCAVYSSI
jgi:hypothetical protein